MDTKGIYASRLYICLRYPYISLPKILTRNKTRLRMLPPYREQFAQSFAHFYSRIGLPENLPAGIGSI